MDVVLGWGNGRGAMLGKWVDMDMVLGWGNGLTWMWC